MDGTTIAIIGLAALFILLFIRMPVGTAMMLVGTVGIFAIRPAASLPVLANEIFSISTNQTLTIIPLFILMGNLSVVSGMSRDLYNAAHSWLGHFRGGLASATIVGCAGFSAVSGSSLATVVTMGRVSLPEMQRFNYDNGLATGAIAAGGTLGILIPPSAGFAIYAILTEESIGRLFLAGVFPGILLTLLFIASIWLVSWRDPSRAPVASDPAPLRERVDKLMRAGWIILVTATTIGGIYAGVFSAIEAAGVGAFFALLVTILRGKMSWVALKDVCGHTLKTSGTVFLILFGAFVFKTFIGFTGVAYDLSTWVEHQNFSSFGVVFALLLVLMILGTFLDGFAMLVLVVPLAHPILEGLGVNLVWFGVLMVITLEMALISPPIGINVFAVKDIAPNVSLRTIYRGIWPFWCAMLVGIISILLLPEIALFLPDTMFG